ncbi:hypothetical protein BaRGS_00038897, partial [Batillaria attramentaria]
MGAMTVTDRREAVRRDQENAQGVLILDALFAPIGPYCDRKSQVSELVLSASLPDPQVLCPTFVDEGERLMCECSSPNDVNIPTITWPGHSDTYILDKDNISRHDNGTIFICRMESNGQISTAIYTLQVAYDQSDVTDQSSVSSTVTIDSVNATGWETYCICTAEWEPGKCNITYELNNSAIVYIEYAATILNFTINNSSDVVEMNQSDHTTATLECTSLGQPTPELRMTRHGEEIQGNVIKSSGYVENVLVISDVTCEDMGTYMCLADNGQQDTRSVRLIVNCAPTLIDHEGDSNLPEMAVNGLFLSMVAHPVPYSFSWEHTRQSDNNGTRNIATLFLVTCVNSGHLEYLVTCEIHAVNLSETEAGLYSVSLSNGYGEYTYNFKISGDQGLTQEDESSPEGGIDDIIISLSVVGGLAFFVLLFIGIKTALSCVSK